MPRIRHLVLTVALAVIALPAGGTLVSGCTQPLVPISVIAGAQTAAMTAQTVVTGAQAAWPIILAAIPAAQQAAAQEAFDSAVFASNHAILALDDAIQAAIAANNANPDLTAVISQVADAVAQVVAIVQRFHLLAPPAAVARMKTSTGVDAIGDLSAASARLKTFATKK